MVNLVKNKMNLVPRDWYMLQYTGDWIQVPKSSLNFFPLNVLKIVIGEQLLLKFLQYGEKEVYDWMEDFISEWLKILLCS